MSERFLAAQVEHDAGRLAAGVRLEPAAESGSR